MARRPVLTQEQLRAIFAQNRSRGLRATINALRERGHRASDWRTLYHGTPRKNLKRILDEGFHVAGSKYRGVDTGIYFGNRTTASGYGNTLVKTRLVKNDLSPRVYGALDREEDFDSIYKYFRREGFSRKESMRAARDAINSDIGRMPEVEWISTKPVSSQNIRSIHIQSRSKKRDLPWDKRWRRLSPSQIDRERQR